MVDTITVFMPAPEARGADSRAQFSAQVTSPTEIDVDPAGLSDQLDRLVRVAESVRTTAAASRYELAEIELQLVVTASGKLAILGSGLTSGVTAGITVKIVKRAS